MQMPDTATLPQIFVTKPDLVRLRDLVERSLDGGLTEAAERLEHELERAKIVPQDQIPPNVVTMRSRAVCRDIETDTVRELELVYPREADSSAGKISVLAPMGVALLGLRVGSTIRWPMPRGRTVTLELLEVRYQPEAAGAFDL